MSKAEEIQSKIAKLISQLKAAEKTKEFGRVLELGAKKSKLQETCNHVLEQSTAAIPEYEEKCTICGVVY